MPRHVHAVATRDGSGQSSHAAAQRKPAERDPFEAEAERMAAHLAGAPPASAPPPAAPDAPDAPWRRDFGARFGHDFSQVHIHADGRSAEQAAALGARAFTVGGRIHFGAGRFAPHTPAGRKLLAHELTHTLQQGAAAPLGPGAPRTLRTPGPRLQCDIDEAQLPSTPVEQILADPNYFERGITSIDYYTAELAVLHYGDGSQIRLGLVPDEIDAPFEAVDYRTPRSAHLVMSPRAGTMGTGSVQFIPRGAEANFPEDTTAGDLPRIAEAVGRRIRFTHHDNGRIVPTEVNTITAPRLCEALRTAEAEYVRRFDANAEATVEVLETLEWVIMLYSIYTALAAGTARAAAGRGAGAAGAGMVARSESTLARFFTRLLGSGRSGSIVVEGVEFGSVRASMRGTEMVVSRHLIHNASGVAGRGRLMHAAFEQAAIQSARSAGASTARVALGTVQNTRWAAYLESQGYVVDVIANEIGGFSRVLTKVFTL
jgi:hypothetical protein